MTFMSNYSFDNNSIENNVLIIIHNNLPKVMALIPFYRIYCIPIHYKNLNNKLFLKIKKKDKWYYLKVIVAGI